MRNKYIGMNRKLDLKELVYQIVFLIINRKDYNSAAVIMLENDISIDRLCNSTIKLTPNHIATLADELLDIK